MQVQNAERREPDAEQISEFLKASAGDRVLRAKAAPRCTTGQSGCWCSRSTAGKAKKQRGAIRAYLSKVTGLSLPQITRLMRKYARTGSVEAKAYPAAALSARSTARPISCCWRKWMARTSA